MEFARKQLEKYGWSDGKGLGKKENGISEPLKPKLKRSVAGIGYDAAADFTEHWWSALYDKAASNYQVEEENGKTKKMKRVEDKEFEITNSTWRLKKKSKDDETEEYSDFFVRTAVLGSGGSKTTKVKDSDSEDEVTSNAMLTDDQLFAACQGRTAHKGARHGLRALGKLARIEEQEKQLLKESKYNKFLAQKVSNSDEVVEDTNLNDKVNLSKKKKKRKYCKNNGNESSNNVFMDVPDKDYSERIKEAICETDDNVDCNEQNKPKKSKKKKESVSNVGDSEEKLTKKRKVSKNNSALDEGESKMDSEICDLHTEKSLKKKKKSNNYLYEI